MSRRVSRIDEGICCMGHLELGRVQSDDVSVRVCCVVLIGFFFFSVDYLCYCW